MATRNCAVHFVVVSPLSVRHLLELRKVTGRHDEAVPVEPRDGDGRGRDVQPLLRVLITVSSKRVADCTVYKCSYFLGTVCSLQYPLISLCFVLRGCFLFEKCSPCTATPFLAENISRLLFQKLK